MGKIIYCFLIALAVFTACKDDQVGIITYTRKINLSKSSIGSFNLQAAYLYSTDGGNTFAAFPSLKNGQTYQAKVVYNPDPTNYTFPDDGSIQQISTSCYTVDWSASDPAPINVDAATGIATFVVGGKNQVMATVTDAAPFSVDVLAGTYKVVQDDWADTHVGDHLTVQRIDATHFQIMEYPATDANHAPLVVTVVGGNASKGDELALTTSVKAQDNGYYSSLGAGSEMKTTGSGIASSCAGTINLSLDFTLPGYGKFTGNVLSLKKIN